MNKIQRVAALGGVIVLLIAAGRVLTPFSTREVLNPDSARGAVYRTRECGIALAGAVTKPSIRSEKIVLSSAGTKAKAESEAARDAAIGALQSQSYSKGLTFSERSGAYVPQVGTDESYDHTILTTFTLSACQSAARRRVTSAGVLTGLAAIGTLLAVLLLGDSKRRDLAV